MTVTDNSSAHLDDQTRNAIDSPIVEHTMTAEMIRRHSYDCVRDNRHTFPMPIVETHGTLLCFIDVPGLRWLRGEPLGIGNSGSERSPNNNKAGGLANVELACW